MGELKGKILRMWGKIEVVTGLHIGGLMEYEVGGVDNVVVKDEKGYPYIPGSSLKGKLRSLYETLLLGSEGIVDCKEGEKDEKKLQICELFGSPNFGRGILLFRDSFLSPEWKERSLDEIIEVKAETAIDRKTGKAKGGTLRFTERVKPGVTFDMEIIAVIPERLEEKWGEEKLKTTMEMLFNLLEKTYLGGMGSRGYGKVKVHFEGIKDISGEVENVP